MNTINFVNNKNNTLENGMDRIIGENKSSLNIANHTSSVSKNTFSLSIHNKDVRLELLNSVKNTLQQSYGSNIEIPSNSGFIGMSTLQPLPMPEFDYEKYVENVPEEVKLAERRRAMEFLNPNQKFFSEADENSYKARFRDANINFSYLTDEEKQQLFENYPHHKSQANNEKALNGFDKRNDFDSTINNVYFAKKFLETSNPLTDAQKKETNRNIDILQEVNEKVLLISQDSTSIKEKENLRNEIESLLEGFDASLLEEEDAFNPEQSFKPKLLNDLDKVIDKQKLEFEKLSASVLNINSMSEAIKYQEQIEKLDVNFEDLLSGKEKENYLQNKQSVILLFKFGEQNSVQEEKNGLGVTQNSTNVQNTKDYSAFKEKLDQEFVKAKAIAEEEISKLREHPGGTDKMLAFGAQKYLELSDKWSSIMGQTRELEQHHNWVGQEVAHTIIDNEEKNNTNNNVNKELDTLIENIEKLIYLFELNEENPNWNDKNMIDYNKDSSAFDASNIKAKNGSFVLSNNSNINSSNVYSLISQ
jgi:hypothetical protein